MRDDMLLMMRDALRDDFSTKGVLFTPEYWRSPIEYIGGARGI
jgi:hypothetical protein